MRHKITTLCGSLVLVTLSLYLVEAGDSTDLYYECNTDGTIFAVNPDPNYFFSATASSNSTLCPITMSSDLNNITISGCPKEHEIEFTVSTRAAEGAIGDGIIGGGDTESFVLYCAEIQAEGIMFTAGLEFQVERQAEVTGNGTGNDSTPDSAVIHTQPPVTPSFAISTVVRDSTDTNVVTTATIGDTLRWVITGPYEYDLLAVECVAYAGSTVGEGVNKDVIANGCSLDPSLLLDFETTSINATEKGELYTIMSAFRFYDSEDLTLACTMKTCPRGSQNCTQSCSKRKRRGLFEGYYGDEYNLVVTHLRITMSASTNIGFSRVLLMVSMLPILSIRHHW